MTRNLTIEKNFVSSKSLTVRYSYNIQTRLLAGNIDVLGPGPGDDKNATPVHEAVRAVFKLPKFSDTINTFELTLPDGYEPKRWVTAMLDGVEQWLMKDGILDFLD